MRREDRKFLQFVIVAFIVVLGIMVVGAALVDPKKPADPAPKVIEGPSVECKPYHDGVICISATSVTR